jgi:hypothetical protein
MLGGLLPQDVEKEQRAVQRHGDQRQAHLPRGRVRQAELSGGTADHEGKRCETEQIREDCSKNGERKPILPQDQTEREEHAPYGKQNSRDRDRTVTTAE